ncbi:hypothetical protein GGI04_004377, partial [Coemansia thaxteri]
MSASDSSYVLVTGGTGFIGSHTVLELVTQGYNVVVADNMYNGCEEPLRRIEKLANLKDRIPLCK